MTFQSKLQPCWIHFGHFANKLLSIALIELDENII